jgi:hypothetical protein
MLYKQIKNIEGTMLARQNENQAKHERERERERERDVLQMNGEGGS